MARLFGYYANQSDRLRCALARERDALSLRGEPRIDGWGVGSYQGGEVLLRKRPTEQREGVDFVDLVRDLRTDCAVVHVRMATVGARSLDNTHPFRFRQWVFAHNGSIQGLPGLRETLLARVPDHLRRAVRGETDSEVLFALALTFIHETGRLDDPELDRRALATALQKTVTAVDEATDAAGAPRATLNAVLTNHRAMTALRRGLPMHWVRRHGIRDCEVCRKPPELAGREPRRVDHEALRYVIVASDHHELPEGWTDVPERPNGAIVAIDRALDVQVIEL